MEDGGWRGKCRESGFSEIACEVHQLFNFQNLNLNLKAFSQEEKMQTNSSLHQSDSTLRHNLAESQQTGSSYTRDSKKVGPLKEEPNALQVQH